jgi:hypothetical protein
MVGKIGCSFPKPAFSIAVIGWRGLCFSSSKFHPNFLNGFSRGRSPSHRATCVKQRVASLSATLTRAGTQRQSAHLLQLPHSHLGKLRCTEQLHQASQLKTQSGLSLWDSNCFPLVLQGHRWFNRLESAYRFWSALKASEVNVKHPLLPPLYIVHGWSGSHLDIYKCKWKITTGTR